MMPSTFVGAKNLFDQEYGTTLVLPHSLVPVDGKPLGSISLKNTTGERSEEYFKWQFIHALIHSGLYSKDYLGAEVQFPKGNKKSAPIKIDACVFDDKQWINYYTRWRESKDDDAVEWLRSHLIGTIEFKKSDGKDIKSVYTSQIKPEIKESEATYCVGFYYDDERLFIFQRKNGRVLRYDESKNQKGDNSGVTHLSLDLTDSYNYIPSFEALKKRVNAAELLDRSKRTVNDLDAITGAASTQINQAISNILRALDQVGLRNTRGYEILVELLALKIFDEKRSETFLDTSDPKKYLEFYQTNVERAKLSFFITEPEKVYSTLSDPNVQSFVNRIRALYNDAAEKYRIILQTVDTATITWEDEGHIRAIGSVVENLQDYSFIRSTDTDLYQLVFYRFANEFTKAEKAQFITPLKIIDFLVKIVNPRKGERIIDPTVGIADFLSMSYVNSNKSIDDHDIYGIDNDVEMVKLAQLNMLLNGDGNATLKHQPDKGSLLFKFNIDKELVPLDPALHKRGNWDHWVDGTRIMKFNVVLTNPPFGENRKFEPKNEADRGIAELYELWHVARAGEWIDPGLLFLENGYRLLAPNGRIGIVLSNSIASIDRWEQARRWLIDHMRVVALFDLPPNVFAETGVNTTLIIAYRPMEAEFKELKATGYEVFARDIQRIGYEVRTSNRVKYFNPIYLKDEKTFEPVINEFGETVLDEQFTSVVEEFRAWCLTQEETLTTLFLGAP